ncbi:MAG: hypothetical protein ABI391_01515 [Hyphomicrobiaceae bacterium]
MSEIKPFERSARRDIRWWGMFLVGSIMCYGASTIESAQNCDESGRDCAPWLVPFVMVVGGVFGLLGAARLVANHRNGSRIDPATGDLIWWQGRYGTGGGNEGRIHPSRIGRISIVSQSDDMDEVQLYDLDGERQPYFDGEVIPVPFEGWARQLAEKWPNIQVEHR